MRPAEDTAGASGRPAWSLAGGALEASPGSTMPEGEFAAIVRRAAHMGIPAWRISVALGRSLPRVPNL